MKNINSTIKKYTFRLGNMGVKKQEIVVPVFLPFKGCPYRCIFCAQDKQTGLNLNSETVPLAIKFDHLLRELRRKIDTSIEKISIELAFYGGTFTLLPPKIFQQCLDIVKLCYNEGLIERARCSTRPDALSTEVLTQLKAAGFQLIELGVQSFSNTSLDLVRRGYDKNQILEGCKKIASVGLEFGIQLLPGMPGSTPEVFLNDVQQALALSPACLRFYPCLVIDGIELAITWKKGLYQPWDLKTTVKTLGKALADAWSFNIPVIRLSLAPEESLDKSILAGPRHPALGSMVQGEALLYLIENIVQNHGCLLSALYLPSFCRGFFYGHSGNLKERWANIGISKKNVFWSNNTYGEVFFVQ